MIEPYRFHPYNLHSYWKGVDQLNELLLIKNQEFPTFEALTSKLEQITQLIRETYPKYLIIDHPTIQSKSFIYIYEKFDAIYRQEFSVLQNLYQNPHDPSAEIESKRKISALLKYEMTISKIAKYSHEVQSSQDLVSLIQVLFHDSDLLDKLLFMLNQNCFGSMPHPDKVIPPNTKVYNFILSFFKNSSSIFQEDELVMEKILSDIKELLINSTNLKENALYDNFELALKSDPHERKMLFSKVFTFKQEFKTEDAFYELLGHLSLLNYYCNEGKIHFLRLKALIFLYAFDFSQFWKGNPLNYDSTLIQKLSNVQPLHLLLKTKFISSSLQKTLEMLLQEVSEDLLELLEFQLLVINSTCQIAKGNPSISQESYYDLFLERESSIWDQLYEFIENNKGKLEKINSKYQFFLPLYDSILGEWIDFIRHFQGESFVVKRENRPARVIPKYQELHLKNLNKLLFLLSSSKSRFLQESIIGLLNKTVEIDSSYLSKFDLKKIFYLAEQQILEKFLPNLNKSSSTIQVFPRLLRVIQSCFKSVHSDLLNSDDYAFLSEMQNSKLFKKLFALYGKNSKIASNITEKSKLNDYLSIIHFFMQLLNFSSAIYIEKKSYRSQFIEIMQDFLSSELQLIDQVQYSIMAADLIELFYKIRFFTKFQDKQTIFLYLKFCFFHPQYKMTAYIFNEFQFLKNSYQQIIESHPEHKTLLAEMMILLLNAHGKKIQDPSFNLWEELRKIENNIVEENLQEQNNSSQKEDHFIFPIDSKVSENMNLELYQDVVKRMTFKSLVMSCFVSRRCDDFTPENFHLITDMIKACSRVIMSPLLIFLTPFCILRAQNYFNEFCYQKEGQVNTFIECLIIGINKTFETFKLNDENLFCEISLSNISAVFSEISQKGFLSVEFIPNNLTWREAAIASVILMLRLYRGYLHAKFGPEFSPEFLKANQNLKALFDNYLREISKEQNFSQDCLKNLSILKILFEKWGGFCYVISHGYSFRKMVEDVYKPWISGFDFNSDNKSYEEKKISVAYNVVILNNLLSIFSPEEWKFQKKDPLVQTLLTIEIFQHFLSLQNQILAFQKDDDMKSLELHFLNNQIPHFLKSFYDPTEFHTVHLENTNYETQALRNFAAIKQVLSNKNVLTILNTNNKPLIKNLNGIIDCCFDMYRIYDNYIGNKVKKFEAQLVLVKAKNSKRKDIQDEEEDMGLGMFGDPDEDQEENYPEPAEEEEEDPFGGFNIDDEPVQEAEEGKDEEVIELENSLKEFLDQCKDEVESFLECCLPNLLYFIGLDDRLLNFKINSATIPKNFWPNQYESIYKTTLLYVARFLDETEISALLEKEAANITQNPLEIDTFTLKSSIPAQDELMTLNLLYNFMAKFFTSNFTRSLNFSSDCIYGLVSATNSRLKELIKTLPESGHQTQFFNDLAKFLQDLAKLAIHLIVTTVSKTYCIVNNTDSSFNSFLLLALELIENALLIQEIAASNFGVGLLELEYKDTKITVATTLIQLANVTLAANKNLRISFVEKGILDRILTSQRFTLWTRKEADAILSLFALILEDCFPFETQVELIIKEFVNENKKNERSLNALLNSSKFAVFKDHPRSLNPIKAYALVHTENIDPTTNKQVTLTLKDIKIQDSIGKSFLIDYTKNQEKVNAVEYLQRAVSPLAQKSIQTLFRAFIQNLAFEKNLIQQKISQETPLKEIKSVIELLASIIYNFPYLTPYIVFQQFKENQTSLDALLTFALERDSESALFLVGSLLKGQNLSVSNSGESIKNVLLLKILDIINNMLDIDNSQNEAFSSFETTSMRFHIAQVLAFINKQVHSEEGFENKESMAKLISMTTQKLFKGIKNAFKLIAQIPDSNFIFEISQIVNISIAGLVVPRSTEGYVNFLRAIEKENDLSATEKNFPCDEKFNQYVFKYEEGISEHKQQIFHWNEEELKKYETQKFYMFVNLEHKSDFTLNFPLNENTSISDQRTFVGLRENLEYQHHKHSQYFKKHNQGSTQIIDYLNHYRNQSPVFSQIPQAFHERLDPNRSNSFKKFQLLPSQNPIPFNNLKISTSPYSAFLQEEQLKLKENPIPLTTETEIISNTAAEQEIQEIISSKAEEEEKINPAESQDEYQEYDSEGVLRIDYFVRGTDNETRPLDFFFNKALQKARRLKEIIQLEKVYNKTVYKEETNPDKIKEIVNNFTKNLVNFDKSILYTVLGKEIRSCLSPELQTEIKTIEKQLKAIKNNLAGYYEANAILLAKRKKEPGYEEVKDDHNDPEDEYYDEYYDEFDYDDFRFLKENQQNEPRKEETLSDEESVPVSVEKEDPEIIKTIRTFKLDDTTVLELCMPFFGDYSKSTAVKNPIIQFSEFLNDSLFKNPANELKILDTLLFILETPELMEHTDELPVPLKSLLNNPPRQQITAKNILEYLSICLSSTKSFIYLTPIAYLNKFGNQLLKNLKERTNFHQKTENCYSVLDLIIGLLDNKIIAKDEENIKNILDAIKNIFASDNQIDIGRGDPNNVVTYKNYISSKNLHILFSLISSDDSSYKSLSNLMESFGSQPKLLISLQDDLIDIFSSNAGSLNKIIEPSLAQDDFEKIMSSLHLTKQAKIIEILLRCFTSVCQKFSITEKSNQKISSNLQNLMQTLFNQEDVHKYFLNIYQLLEILKKHQDSLQLSNYENSFEILLKICFFHSSVFSMTSSFNSPPASINSLSELDSQLPQLKKLVTKDQYDFITFQKSSQPQSATDFNAIFASFTFKYTTAILHLRTKIKDSKDDQLFLDIFLVLVSKWPWLLDLKSKQEIIREKISSQYKRVGISSDDRRSIYISRRNVVHSSINSFKNLEENEILKNIHVSFRNESGFDGGGLRRNYYILIGKELFAPEFGLFKLSANKHSIQPNPLSSIIPNYLLYFEFAGLIVAKAIEDEQLMDINFTKSFLKHILGKEPAISDLEDYDADLAKNLQWMLENNVEDLSATFTYETEILDQRITKELCEGGFDIEVTEENKKDYIKKVCEAEMTKEIQKQVQAFLKGFRTILPKDILSHLSTSELQLLISGAPEIDLEDMKKYANVYLEAGMATWVWEILSEFNREEIAAFWYFVSGSSKVPYGGFKDNPIEMSSSGTKGTLPTAGTCSRSLRIPTYESKEELKQKLLTAIFDGAEVFYLS